MPAQIDVLIGRPSEVDGAPRPTLARGLACTGALCKLACLLRCRPVCGISRCVPLLCALVISCFCSAAADGQVMPQAAPRALSAPGSARAQAREAVGLRGRGGAEARGPVTPFARSGDIGSSAVDAGYTASAVSIPIQSDIVLPDGEAVIFIGCHLRVHCSGLLTVRLDPADSVVEPVSNLAGSGVHERTAAWLRRREASTNILIARRRVRLRQRRVSPVPLRLRPRALSLLAYAAGPLAFDVLVQTRAGARFEGSIVLRLASSRGRAASAALRAVRSGG